MSLADTRPQLDIAAIRRDFPILGREINGHPLAYLDNAATTQKPRAVIDAIVRYYEHSNANVHRGIHALGEEATTAYEGGRKAVARFLNVPADQAGVSVVFTRNASEALNLVAWGHRRRLQPGDQIITTPMEHHSNLVPWQQLALATGASLRFMELLPDGTLDLDSLDRLLAGGRTKIVAFTHASNVLGTINPAAEINRRAHAHGAVTVLDAAQSAPHMTLDVQALDCDFLALSAHKMLGPTGIGALYGKPELLADLDPFLFGGNMIRTVRLEGAEWAGLPDKFETGTPHIAGAAGWAAAIEYIERIGMDRIHAYEQELTQYAWERLSALDGITLYGPPRGRAGLIAFNIEGVHPHDVSAVLDSEGVAIRVGHHCAQPLAQWLGVPATNRASFYLYNTREEIDRLVSSLVKAKEFFGHAVG